MKKKNTSIFNFGLKRSNVQRFFWILMILIENGFQNDFFFQLGTNAALTT